MTGTTILVTGGAGYVGSHSVVQLLNEGYKVVVIDNLVNASKECLKRVEEITGKEVTYYTVDLCNKEQLDEVFKKHKFGCVIHFAALKAVGESVAIPLTYYKNNIGGTVTLLEAMKEHNVKKIVYSSSATVYGTPQKLPLTEEHPTGIGCTNPYGRSKYFAEEILKDLIVSDKSWGAISLRYFNPVGAHESGRIGEDPKGIPNNIMPYIAQVAVGRRKDLKIFGNDYNTPDGTGVRDYVHIQDLAVGHIAAAKKILDPGFSGFKGYNLGTGSGLSVLQLIKAFEEASGQKVPYEIVGRRPGDIDASYADVSLAKKELGWEAKKDVLDMCLSGATVLVTGGAGYIGSHCVVELLNLGMTVVVIDNFVNASPVCLDRVEEISGKKVILYVVDLCQKKYLEDIFKDHKFDCVVHFAALKSVAESVATPLRYYNNNVGGTLTLLEVMKEHEVKKLIYSSSATVYGLPQELPLTENHPTGIGCTNPYGKSKYFVEEILKDLVVSDGSWSVISLRYFNPIGAHESGKIGEDPRGIPNNVVPYIAQVAIGRRKDLKVFGNDYNTIDGTGVRDYVHVEDLALGHTAALKKILEPDFSGWKVYNLGTGNGISVLELVKIFEEAAGRKIPYEIVERRPGDIEALYADTSLAKKELHWQAEKNISDMCKDMWRWQSKNPNGFEGSEDD